MPLTEGQVQIRDLIIGPGTSYRFRQGAHFNPFVRSTRTTQTQPRAWNDGAWSGAEWKDQAVLDMRLVSLGEGAANFVALHQALAAAFAPSHEDLDLRFMVGGVEYLMRGRPRLVEPQPRMIVGFAYYRCGFIANDPTIYSGAEHSVSLGLPSTSGGLTVPLTVPFSIGATVTGGRAFITNAGTDETGLRLRIDGPVIGPRITLLTAAGTATLRFFLTLEAGQWLDIDTAVHQVYLNGQASRRGLTSASGLGWPMLPANSSAELAFDASVYSSSALLTAFWRDAWD